MKIKDVMNEVVAVEKDISIKEAAKIMADKDIGSLVVVKGEKIIGIITKKDIVKNISNSNKNISTISKNQIFTVDQNDDLEEAAMIMAKNKVKHLPVIEGEEGRLVGIITSTEIIQNSEDLEDDFFVE